MCRLRKALYGLKQALRAWFQRLSSFLINHGFLYSKAETSPFVFEKNMVLIYLLVYVDEIIFTRNDNSAISDFICQLHSEFAITRFGHFGIFFGS